MSKAHRYALFSWMKFRHQKIFWTRSLVCVGLNSAVVKQAVLRFVQQSCFLSGGMFEEWLYIHKAGRGISKYGVEERQLSVSTFAWSLACGFLFIPWSTGSQHVSVGFLPFSLPPLPWSHNTRHYLNLVVYLLLILHIRHTLPTTVCLCH